MTVGHNKSLFLNRQNKRVIKLVDDVPELVPSIKRLLLNGQYNRAQVLIVCEVVPVFCSVEVLLVSLLFHGGEFEAT